MSTPPTRERQRPEAAQAVRRRQEASGGSLSAGGGGTGGGGLGGGSSGDGTRGGPGGSSAADGWRGWLRLPRSAIALAVAVAIGIGTYVALPATDSISTQQNEARVAQYEALVAAGGMPLELVSLEDMDIAIASLPENVSQEQREELRTAVEAGHVQLAWLTVWDTHVEDGDVLRFESSVSFPIEVMALKRKTTIAIPLPPEGTVRVTGVRDGGGGITIGLESGAARIEWPTMQPGDTLDLPVRPAF